MNFPTYDRPRTLANLRLADKLLSAGLISPLSRTIAVQAMASMDLLRSARISANLGHLSTSFVRPPSGLEAPPVMQLLGPSPTSLMVRPQLAEALQQLHFSGLLANDFNADNMDGVGGPAFPHFSVIPGIRSGREWTEQSLFHFQFWGPAIQADLCSQWIDRRSPVTLMAAREPHWVVINDD